MHEQLQVRYDQYIHTFQLRHKELLTGFKNFQSRVITPGNFFMQLGESWVKSGKTADIELALENEFKHIQGLISLLNFLQSQINEMVDYGQALKDSIEDRSYAATDLKYIKTLKGNIALLKNAKSLIAEQMKELEAYSADILNVQKEFSKTPDFRLGESYLQSSRLKKNALSGLVRTKLAVLISRFSDYSEYDKGVSDAGRWFVEGVFKAIGYVPPVNAMPGYQPLYGLPQNKG